jgi:ribosomal protein L12E/L44/L45/RPP1/RPP2
MHAGLIREDEEAKEEEEEEEEEEDDAIFGALTGGFVL